MRTYDLIGSTNIKWPSDYPHSDTTWPNSRKAIEEHFGDLPDEDCRAMTCDNASRLYSLI
jgi:predicted TIM-barrel fold metal-dependent hydrolase